MLHSSEVDDLSTEDFDSEEELDNKSTLDVLRYMNQHDRTVPDKVALVLPQVAEAVNLIAGNMSNGGRLLYIGAGTSGRLGILDAAECPPTFGTDESVVVGIIAGGDRAIQHAIENVEDLFEQGAADIEQHSVTAVDSVVGISASGRTPYVLGALDFANRAGALTIAISNNDGSKIGRISDIAIDIPTGPEVLAGSTRLKAGTAQKLVLNMISTAVMVQLGKVYRNLMVDMRSSNEKLVRRAERIISHACQCSEGRAKELLDAADGDLKAAIVMGVLDIDLLEARNRLDQAGGFIRGVLNVKGEA